MCSHVSVQLIFVHKRFATLITLVVFDTTVYHQMMLEVGLGDERLVAKMALKVLCPSVPH